MNKKMNKIALRRKVLIIALVIIAISAFLYIFRATKMMTNGAIQNRNGWQTYQDPELGFSFSYPTSIVKPTIEKFDINKDGDDKLDFYSKLTTINIDLSVPTTNKPDSYDLRKGITVVVGQYDPKNPVQHNSYESLTWTVNYQEENKAIQAKNEGIYEGSAPASFGTQLKKYAIALVAGHKARIYYSYFNPGASYSKITEIYYGQNKYLKIDCGIADYNVNPKDIVNIDHPFTQKSTGVSSLDNHFELCDQVVSTISLSD
ncbi:MAG: hypothetical protein Q7R49_07170 [Candidatus Daviesbacteria bacterium]|nr:hypothetical protein [Candidatus Daviesbacteria bacterium]